MPIDDWFCFFFSENVPCESGKVTVTNDYNKFVRTKMRLKLGTKIDLSERFVRFVRFAGLLDLSDVRFDDFRD